MSGPVAWGGLCSSAESQSPIDLPVAPYGGVAVQGYTARVNSKGWTFQYGNEQERCTVSNVGPGSMVVKFQGKTPYAFIDGKQLELLQFHFHTPSEHAFSGNRYPMEVHLVHK